MVIGASAGGSQALAQIFPCLPGDYPWPVIVVQHLHPLQDGAPSLFARRHCALAFKEVDDKDAIRPGWVFFAPPNYHLLVEDEHTFALSIDARVHYTRPSIDVLFESAADAYGPALVGVVLSGANDDGAAGLYAIKRRGGLTIAQDPASAEAPHMPQAAITAARPDHILPPPEIGALLARLPKG